jgi:hypothetical protein
MFETRASISAKESKSSSEYDKECTQISSPSCSTEIVPGVKVIELAKVVLPTSVS